MSQQIWPYFLFLFRLIVHGGWGHWTEWDDCPVTCGGSVQERTRVCDSPEPKFGGHDCTWHFTSGSEKQMCNENACSSKPSK